MSEPPWPTTAPDSRHPTAGQPRVSLHDALPPGTRLDEFEILSVLGIGAFGIVYLAYDHVLVRRVAIKEYMPAALAARRDGLPVTLRSPEFASTFERGLDSFLSEARLLASFDHPALVKVHRFWRANDTAYMAMQHYPGATLKDVRQAMSTPPDEAWLVAITEPLLDALDVLHRQGVFHRDVSPDNILILPNGRPVLLDFGAARRVIGNGSQFLSAVLKPPFAPVEQYANDVERRQGPWTDLYALGATLWFALLGNAPTPSVVRAVDDALPLLASGDDERSQAWHGPLLATIDWMLALAPDERPRDVESVRRVLRGEVAPPMRHVAHRVHRADDNAPRAAPHHAAAGNDGSAQTTARDAQGHEEHEAHEAHEQRAPTTTATGAFAAPAAPLLSRRDLMVRHPRAVVAAFAVLGAVVLATGAWTLNRTGPASPALVSLAAALGSAGKERSPRPPRVPTPTAAEPTRISASAGSSAPPAIAIAPESVSADSVETALWPASVEAQSTAATDAPPASTAEAASTRTSRRVRAPDHRVAARSIETSQRTPARDRGVRTRTAAAPVAGACSGLSTFSHVLCALRECKSPAMTASPKCVRNRQLEQARLARMERE